MNGGVPRRNNSEVLEGRLAPLEELEPFLVSFEFSFFILLEGLRSTSKVHLHRVVDDQIDWALRVHFFSFSSQVLDSISQPSQVNHEGHSGEILEDDSRRFEGNFGLD